jgi:WD40 repeat protein
VSGVPGNQRAVLAIQFTPDGKGLAAAFQGTGVGFWKAATMAEEQRFAQTDHLFCAALSPDGRHIAWLGQHGALKILDAANGQERYRVSEGLGTYLALAFSHDSRMLAVGQNDGVVRVLETGTGKERLRFEGHSGMVGAIAFAPDGRRLASSGRDTTVLIWDLIQDAAAAGPLTDKELKSLWADLIGQDAGRAYRATLALAGAPKEAVPFLRETLGPVPKGSKTVANLITDLDADDFAVREKASAELARLGKAAEAELRQALEKSPSVEVKGRAKLLLASLTGPHGAPELPLRWLRVIEVLERADTPSAVETLETLARGSDPLVAEEARTALQRLKKTNGR